MTQLTLGGTDSTPEISSNKFGVPGLEYWADYITPAEEKLMVKRIDAGEWESSLQRRVQQYGWAYDYRRKRVFSGDERPTPKFAQWMYDKIAADKIMEPQQAIVNEYLPDQGISAHTDARCFGPIVCSLSLLSPVDMVFSDGQSKTSVTLEPRSLLVLTGTGRSHWTHEIPPLDPDHERRLSFTCRTLRELTLGD